MKKFLCLALALVLTLGVSVSALASGTTTVLKDQKDRRIQTQGQLSDGTYPVNPDIPGESPTTGELWEGLYMPMLVQISNGNGGIGEYAPWGALDADIIYESPLQRNGDTRLSFLFSNTVPEDCGPVRSARVSHCWLREEWDAGFLFYGGQTAKGTNINDVFSETGANKKGVLFPGTAGSNKPWKTYYYRVKGRAASPNNAGANVLAIQALMPADHNAPHRPFLFTDELPESGDIATTINVIWGHKNFNSSFVYDESQNLYYRYVQGEPYVNRERDSEVDTQLTFSNVIIQRANVTWKGAARPVVDLIGRGNADIFIGGRYIPGYWVRTDYTQRTVFFDENGEELKLQRGKTFIVQIDPSKEVNYSAT